VDSRDVNNRICGDPGKENNSISPTCDDNDIGFDEDNMMYLKELRRKEFY
jgi:hypothetical protein